jgi:hypothetical protein
MSNRRPINSGLRMLSLPIGSDSFGDKALGCGWGLVRHSGVARIVEWSLIRGFRGSSIESL